MIDIHTHILPGLDDGAATIDEALQMARMAVNDGITGVLASGVISYFVLAPVYEARSLLMVYSNRQSEVCCFRR